MQQQLWSHHDYLGAAGDRKFVLLGFCRLMQSWRTVRGHEGDDLR